jgi:hypothetical protein
LAKDNNIMANLNHVALDAAPYGGLIKEDVMEKIWDISNIPLPFTDLCSKGTHSNRRAEFVTTVLAVPVTNNAIYEGSDVNQNNTAVGVRLGNFTQIAVKEVQVTDTSESANGFGGINTIAYQVKERQKELRRDIEAQMLTLQASVAGDAASIAGISAGLGAQLKTNISLGATAVAGGFNTGTGLFVAPTAAGGTKRALSETIVRNILQLVYENGGNTKLLMARPAVIRKMSEYLFTSTARVATLTSTSPENKTAYGSVNVFISDFGSVVEMKDNRLQPVDAAGTSSMYFLDPAHLKQSFLRGYQVEPLAKTGLAEKRLMSAQYSLLVLNELSQGAIYAIDETLAMIA